VWLKVPTASTRPLPVLESGHEALPLADLRRFGFWHGRWLWGIFRRRGRGHGRGVVDRRAPFRGVGWLLSLGLGQSVRWRLGL
jgi:hypothetical protein